MAVEDFGQSVALRMAEGGHCHWGSKLMTCVKNQRNSEACLPISTCAVMSAKLAIAVKDCRRAKSARGLLVGGEDFELPLDYRPIPFSAQEMYDCVPRRGLSMNFESAFLYVRDRGVFPSDMYPLTEFVTKEECRSASLCDRKITVKEWRKLSGEVEILAALREQPVIAATYYRSIIFHICDSGDVICRPRDGEGRRKIGHALLIVGFGYDDEGHLYYICKNSYGLEWGSNGYMKIHPSMLTKFYVAGDIFWMSPELVQRVNEEIRRDAQQ